MITNDFEKLKLRKFKMKNILPDATILILGRRRSGKSMMKGEKVLMYDGTIKNVEDINIGELVMGDDSTPRNVLETHNGRKNQTLMIWKLVYFEHQVIKLYLSF